MDWISIISLIAAGCFILIALLKLGIDIGRAWEDRRITGKEAEGIVNRIFYLIGTLQAFMKIVREHWPALGRLCLFREPRASQEYPAPPVSLGKISGAELRLILQNAGLRAIHLGSTAYELTNLTECRRFVKWYQDTHPYTLDEYDCNVFALVQMAEAAKWMHGKFVWGKLWAEGLDEQYKFPNHGFNFIVCYDKKVYFCDELCVAAPADDFIEAYEVKSYLVEA